MAVQDEVAAVEFHEETGLSADEIRAAGRRPLEAGKRFMTTTMSRRALDAERRARSTDRQ